MAVGEFRNLPSVDRVISEPQIRSVQDIYPHSLIVDMVRQRLDQERISIADGKRCSGIDSIVSDVLSHLQTVTRTSLRPVINASGVILHTNLGRAPLSNEAMKEMENVSGSYCNLEFDLGSGNRGSRYVHIERLLYQLSGAESAIVVNNNAAAVLLVLTVLARRKEVIVSRGEAVEIGGGFRIPDVMRQSGAKLVEVGTTNCTYASDYEQAINDRTAFILRIHSSNFKVVGFTNSVSLEDMVAISKTHDVPVLDDLGSGCFIDTTAFGLAYEPMVQRSIELGVGIACFSGDKLVGGPQAGIIVGKKIYLDRLKKHPLVRALRIDKTRLAALSTTLIHYIKGEQFQKVPVWRMISMPLSDIEQRAKLWTQSLDGFATVVSGETMLGGGSLPGSGLPTFLVSINRGDAKKGNRMAQLLSQKLRESDPPIIARINDETLLLDPRSVLPEEDHFVIETLKTVLR